MDEGSPDWINVTCDSKWHLGKGCWCKENRPPFQLFLANLTDPAAEVENRVEGLHLTFGCRTFFSSWARWQKSAQGTLLLVIICLFDAHFINIFIVYQTFHPPCWWQCVKSPHCFLGQRLSQSTEKRQLHAPYWKYVQILWVSRV